MRDQTLAASLMIAVCASIWGLYWLPLRAIEAAGVPGGWAVALFNAPALLGAAAYLAAVGGRDLLNCEVALAGLMAGLGLAFYAMGLTQTTVVRATLLFYLTPVWGTILGMAMLGERPGLLRWAALAAALAGLALTLGLGGDDVTADLGAGEALGLASGVAWAMGAVLIRRSGRSGAALIFHQFLAVVAVSAAAALVFGGPPPGAAAFAAAATPLAIGGSLVLFFSLVGIFRAMARVSPGRSGLLMMTEVVVAVISAAILLPDEALTATEWLGAALIVGAGVAEVFGGERA